MTTVTKSFLIQIHYTRLKSIIMQVIIFLSLGCAKSTTCSVLTRILPWGVPGPPLLRNRGPVRTLGGQSYKKHAVRRTWARTPNCLLHEVPTWSNMAEEVFTIRRRSLRCSGTCVGPMKVKATKLKTLTHFDIMFFIYSNKQNSLVSGWPLKLLKSVWLVACPCALTGASSWF